jgi:hypothetical protein
MKATSIKGEDVQEAMRGVMNAGEVVGGGKNGGCPALSLGTDCKGRRVSR